MFSHIIEHPPHPPPIYLVTSKIKCFLRIDFLINFDQYICISRRPSYK